MSETTTVNTRKGYSAITTYKLWKLDYLAFIFNSVGAWYKLSLCHSPIKLDLLHFFENWCLCVWVA